MTDNGETLADANRRAINHLRDRVDDLEAENGDLRDRVAELEDLIHDDLREFEYHQLTKKDKVRQLQAELKRRAEDANNGKASMNYKAVKWHFDGQPSAGHAYDLMELAGESQGFNYEERGKNQANRLIVNLDAVKADAEVSRVNKPSTSTTP